MKRMASLLPFAAGCLLTGVVPAAMGQVGFPDVPKNHWAYAAVTDLKARGVVVGYPATAGATSPSGTHSGKAAHPRPSQRHKETGGKLISPGPGLSAEQVVRIQVKALQHNDSPTKDSGIATTYRFASPQNQQTTGPLEHFMLIVKNPTYAPMLNCRSVAFGALKQEGNEATETVSVTAADGTVLRYVFLLSRQADGPFVGCWMTDGCVKAEDPDRARRPDETRVTPQRTFVL